ncbi:MAG TPA: SPOR domain-containing protein [Bacteroidota bacterium]|nr:SPOR domain-containing protein [Bacteroidota bacterium]
MPKLNLRDDGFEEESNPLDSDQSVAPPPTLREVGVSGGGGKSSTILTAVLLLAVVIGGVFALNHFKVIHLWGKRTPKITNEAITDQLPPPESPAAAATTDQGSNPAPAEATPTPEPSVEPSASAAPPAATPTVSAPPPSRASRASEAPPKFTPPPSGSGNYTVQVSSWTSKEAADREASRLSGAGMSAFVEDAVIAGENWYRVRVGRYGSSKEAKDAADQLAKSMEGQIWVAKVSAK